MAEDEAGFATGENPGDCPQVGTKITLAATRPLDTLAAPPPGTRRSDRVCTQLGLLRHRMTINAIRRVGRGALLAAALGLATPALGQTAVKFSLGNTKERRRRSCWRWTGATSRPKAST
jgi:hypothetical protein